MFRWQKGFKILYHDGIKEFGKSIKRFFIRSARLYFYKIKSLVLNDYIVTINNISIDLDHAYISNKMLRKIRKGAIEKPETKLIWTHLYDDLPTIDLGAGIGYTTCIIDDLTKSSEIVIAVEANKNLIPIIKQTKDKNQANFKIIHSAYSTDSDEIEFYIANEFWSSSVIERKGKNEEKIAINTTSLDSILSEFQITNHFQLVVDIEGGEHDLILNELEILKEKCKLLIIEFHSFSDLNIDDYKNILEKNGFECIDSIRDNHVYLNRNI